MVALRANPPAEYDNIGGKWVYWSPEAGRMRSEGWKLHIAGRADIAQQILDIVTPALRAMRVNHKFLPDTNDFALQDGEQAGKWFCIYPGSLVESLEVARLVEDLMAAQFTAAQVDPVPADRCVETFVYTRYGSYDSDRIRNDQGTMVLDPKMAGFKPNWIEDVWLSFGALTTAGSRLAVSLPRGWHAPYPAYDGRGRDRA